MSLCDSFKFGILCGAANVTMRFAAPIPLYGCGFGTLVSAFNPFMVKPGVGYVGPGSTWFELSRPTFRYPAYLSGPINPLPTDYSCMPKPSYQGMFVDYTNNYGFDQFQKSNSSNIIDNFGMSINNFSGQPQWSSKPADFRQFINFDTFWRQTPAASKSDGKKSRSIINDSSLFDKMLNYILDKFEGGYNPNDCGQAGNRGIQQQSYDAYRTRKGLATRDVKDITDEEVRDLYYNDYYLACGADKISDSKLAIQVFDTAINMGVGAAKELLKDSNGDLAKFEELRRNRYRNIAEKPDKKGYLDNWLERVDTLHNFAEQEFTA